MSTDSQNPSARRGEQSTKAASEQTAPAAVEAVRVKALKEAAKACEDVAWTHPNAGMLGPELNAMKCAAAIRALATQGTSQPTGSGNAAKESDHAATSQTGGA